MQQSAFRAEPTRHHKGRVDWFLIGMAAAAALAALFPEPGAKGGPLQPELLNQIGVALIFFLHGLTLSFSALRAGTSMLRLHLLIQLSTFVLCPLLGVLTLWLTADRLDPNLRLGIFYLCALPSTVSSSVALTALARGNVPAALFNATLSSVLGVFLTPFWIGLVLGSSGREFPFGEVMLDLTLWLLLPLAVGQALRPALAQVVTRYRAAVGGIDRAIILLLVYTSFCDSVLSGVWRTSGGTKVIVSVGFCVAFLTTLLIGLNFIAKRLGFSEADRIAAVFCGSKKTLASGVPMARLIFGDPPVLGLILLPILIYHPLQLFIGGWLAGRWAKRNLAEAPQRA